MRVQIQHLGYAMKTSCQHQGSTTYESGRVVVTGGLGVSVSLKHRVTLDNLVLKGTLKFAGGFLLLWK